jgi:hypothetical protein
LIFLRKPPAKALNLIEGWYWYDDADDTLVGGPFEDEEDARLAAESGITWANAKQ